MRYLFVLLLIIPLHAVAQMKSDFKILPDKEGATVYQGYCSWSDLRRLPEFAALDTAGDFFPDSSASLGFLQEYLPDYEIIVFLGTWCSDSQDLLPPFYEIMRKTGFPDENITLIALDRDKKAVDQTEQQYAITNVPTFILMRDGKEAGRITEQVQTDMAQDLAGLIRADRQ